MSKFRFFYGFLILIILVGGFYIAKANDLFQDTINYSEPEQLIENNTNGDIEGGLPYPRGTYTLGDIMEAYNISKGELYEALDLPSDTPESSVVIDLIKSGLLKSKTVQGYMTPITQQYE